jgi:cytochrome b pre-mRNA-processing protein 3
MIFGLFRKNKVNHALMVRQYDALTRAARNPAFFESMNVPDTVMGRFEMLSITLILYFRRTATRSRRSPRRSSRPSSRI